MNNDGRRDKFKTVGASEVAALFDESPYESRYSLWAKKCGLIPSDDWDAPTSGRMQIGKDLEKPVLDIWSRRMGLSAVHNTRSFPYRKMDILAATPDGLVEWHTRTRTNVTAVVDVKTVQPGQRKKWAEGSIPKHYWWQLQAQMMCLDVSTSYLVALFGVDEISHSTVTADDSARAMIEESIALFRKQLDGSADPPDPGSHSASSAALLSESRDGGVITLDADCWEMAQNIERLQKEASDIEKLIRKEKNAILQKMGGSSSCVFSDGSGFRVIKVDVKEATRKAYSFQKLIHFKGKDAEDGNQE